MPEEMEVGCARPTGGPAGESDGEPGRQQSQPAKEQRAVIQVGKKAPDFMTSSILGAGI